MTKETVHVDPNDEAAKAEFFDADNEANSTVDPDKLGQVEAAFHSDVQAAADRIRLNNLDLEGIK